jgi:hypothetical protein
MTASNTVEKAERASRARAIVMALGGAVLLLLAAGVAADPDAFVGDRARAAVWGVLVLLWLLVLVSGGGLMLNTRLRTMMNDEVSLDNRRRAVALGFWAAMAAALALGGASFATPIGLRQGLALLTELALAAALLRYAWLERG